MPTARELLEQADALMRRNRRDELERVSPSTDREGRDGGILPRGQPDIPTLEEDVVVDHDAPLTPTVILPEYASKLDELLLDGLPGDDLSQNDLLQEGVHFGNRQLDAGFGPEHVSERVPEAPGAVSSGPAEIGWTVPEGRAGIEWIETLADLPVLTDAVEEAISPSSDPAAGADLFRHGLAPAADDPAPGSTQPTEHVLAQSSESPVVALPAATLAFAELPQAGESPAIAGMPDAFAAPPAAASGNFPPTSADWSELAEEIRSQVLQRLDLFTDTGLREQLGAHLKPIVDQASAELVDAINRKVGELVRSYVAEAIEREIDAWRHRDG